MSTSALLAALLLLFLRFVAAAGAVQAPAWTVYPDEEGNLIVDCGGHGDAACDGRHVEVPQLRVAAASAAASLDIRYDAEDAAFVLEASAGAGVRVDGVDPAAQDALLAALEAENAALLDTQARIQCALIEQGTTGIGEAITIATIGAADWEHFVIDSENFLVVANMRDGDVFQQESVVYKWTNGAFAANQSIATIGAHHWEYFEIDSEHYLAVANFRNAEPGSFDQNSMVFRWSGGEFVANQSIPTIGARDIEHFEIDGEHYLAVANQLNASSYYQDSFVLKWSAGVLVVHQSIPSIGATDWEHFVMGSEHFLVLANGGNASSTRHESVIYKFSRGVFVVNQSIPTAGARDWEHFVMGGEHYLAVANFRDGADYNQASVIYKFVDGVFVVNQTIPTNGGYDWEHFAIGEEHFLALANHVNDGGYLQDSVVFKRNRGTGAFVAYQSIPTVGARAWRHFQIASDSNTNKPELFLAVANFRTPESELQDSAVFRWNSHCFT